MAVDELKSCNIINQTLLVICAAAGAIVSSEKNYSPLTAESWLLIMIFSHFTCLLAQNLVHDHDHDDDGSNCCLQIIKNDTSSNNSTQKKQAD